MPAMAVWGSQSYFCRRPFWGSDFDIPPRTDFFNSLLTCDKWEIRHHPSIKIQRIPFGSIRRKDFEDKNPDMAGTPA